jgi:hypothetical protein
VTVALTGRERLHVWGASGVECWCKPEVEEDATTIVISHRFLDVRPDSQPRMSIYSDQRFSPPELKVGITFD